ncbi:autophagy-like protein 9 [Kwoniella heveanensis BCC8398]|uniref:Autophagy-related protein 9 n=1 Tax=Kwoniella heveanensis BCC8398 TaxID=1296120 RepID=A0A1B9H249_9TREE|nr:autophagy-like protein 9 [Kwoniella heveanensis BCC8398]
MLLKELQGGSETHGARDLDLSDRMSPTPTPTFGRPSHVIATSSSSSSDDGNPPDSLIYGEQHPPGDRTPRSPPSFLPVRTQPFVQPDSTPIPRSDSPGPFRDPNAPSSSTSESQSQSRSTSPGPSTISVYASGLDDTLMAQSSVGATSRDPTASPEPTHTRLPTVREPSVIGRPSPPRRASSSGKAQAKPALTNGSGYLDPSIPSSLAGPSRIKGKGKTRNKGGRKYHGLPAQEEGEVDANERAGSGAGRPVLPRTGLNEYEKALWKWVNVEDLDGFLQEVYDYYKGKGIWCIALARILNLLTTFFVIGFSTFLSSCIDYSRLTSTTSDPDSVGRLNDVLIDQCITKASFPHMLFVVIATGFYVFQLASFILSIPRLLEMYRFYTHLLRIPDADIQTLPWPEIVRLIGEIRKHNPVTSLSNGQAGGLADMVGDDANKESVKKLDAHDVANRILRQENYLIALFNKDLLDLRVRLPVPRPIEHLVPVTMIAPPTHGSLPSHTGSRERKYISFGANTLTKALEWNLRFCLMGYLFDPRGQVRKEFVRERRRKDLVEGLRRRFIFMGVLNAIFAPFIVVYLLLYSFFRYFEEYHKNPSSIGSRQYTLYAQWKFREFNELPHLFERRLDRSYPTAKEYIDQFPKERTALVMRFVAFVAGSFAAVLLVASLVDPDLFLHFEITPHRTVLFYLGVFGSVLAMARGMVPEENMVFDPEASLREVVRWTHYLPQEWTGKLHSQMVHREFGTLFAMKIMIFFTELLSVILTPFILFFSLPPCAGAIIDFFREFSVHVDGVGYVCSFAVFDFRMQNTAGTNVAAEVLDSAEDAGTSGAGGGVELPKARGKGKKQEKEWGRANENKMEKSFLHFKATHPDWQPTDPSSSLFLDRLVGMHQGNRATPIMGQQAHAGGERQGMSGSSYTGGRGLGLGLGLGGAGLAKMGMDEHRLRERSRSYERAWAKSSHLIRPSINNNNQNHPISSPLYSPTRGMKSVARDEDSIIEEEDDEGEHEWTEQKRRGETHRDAGDGYDEEGLWRDEGVVGLLQQILGRS